MHVIIVDLELTKSHKIIQIGAVVADLQSYRITSLYSKICNPGELPCTYIEELTGISALAVAESESTKDVLEDFFKWTKKGPKALYSWGDGDIVYLKGSAEHYSLLFPRYKTCNVKEWSRFFKLAKGHSTKGGLKASLEEFGLSFYGRQHDALIDSFNTARLLFAFQEQIKDRSAKKYKEHLDLELCDNFKNLAIVDLNYKNDYFLTSSVVCSKDKEGLS